MDENFLCNFGYKVLDEVPSVASTIVYIPNEGPGVGRDGMIVKFTSSSIEESWIGIFAYGDMLPSGECKVYPGPGRNLLTILAKGEGYIASPDDPSSFVHVKSCPAIRAIPITNHKLMLFHDYTEIVAYSEYELVWETSRISWDGIKIDEVTENEIIGKSWDAPTEKYVSFKVDIRNGNHQGGSSPPDYS